MIQRIYDSIYLGFVFLSNESSEKGKTNGKRKKNKSY